MSFTDTLRKQICVVTLAAESNRRSPRGWVMNNAVDDLEQAMTKGGTKKAMTDIAIAVGEAVRAEIMAELKGEQPKEKEPETINIADLTDKDSLASKMLNKIGFTKK